MLCVIQTRVVTPSSDKVMGSQASLARSNTRLSAMIDHADKPSVAINGSTQSIKHIIEATEPHKETRNGSAVNVNKGNVILIICFDVE